ncbi:MAG: CvpA family protein [Alphaproteobacteria bacterium]
MESFPVNVTDLAIAGILLLSGVLAFFRGAVRELFSVIAWIGAAGVSYYGFGYVQPFARDLTGATLLADIGAGTAIFIVTLIVLSLISATFTRRVRESRLNALDRSLGFLFGLARGALIVSIAYLIINWVKPPDEQPGWLREARAMPLVEFGAGLVSLAIPPDARAEWTGALGDGRSTAEDAFDTQEALETLMNPPPAAEADADTPGYTSTERKGLDRLIESAQ